MARLPVPNCRPIIIEIWFGFSSMIYGRSLFLVLFGCHDGMRTSTQRRIHRNAVYHWLASLSRFPWRIWWSQVNESRFFRRISYQLPVDHWKLSIGLCQERARCAESNETKARHDVRVINPLCSNFLVVWSISFSLWLANIWCNVDWYEGFSI